MTKRERAAMPNTKEANTRKSRKRPKRPVTPTKRSARPARNDAPERITLRRIRALQLKAGGATYREIAAALDVSLDTAWTDVQTELLALRDTARGVAEEVRALELRRLDDVLKTANVLFRGGSVKAGELIVRVSERRSRLLGLDAPTKVAPTDPTGQHEAQRGIDPARLSTETLERILRETVDDPSDPHFAGGQAERR